MMICNWSRENNWSDGLFRKVILMKDWHTIWLVFYLRVVIAVAFAVCSKHKHNLDVEN
jgi:NHS family xanthosine MFS transporter